MLLECPPQRRLQQPRPEPPAARRRPDREVLDEPLARRIVDRNAHVPEQPQTVRKGEDGVPVVAAGEEVGGGRAAAGGERLGVQPRKGDLVRGTQVRRGSDR